MKKVITILISCSLAFAASVIAQQDEEQQKPKKERAEPERSYSANEARPAPKKESAATRQHAGTKALRHEKQPQSGEPTYKPHTATKVPEKERANAGTQQTDQRNAPNESETETANKPPSPAATSEREQYNGAAGAAQANRPNAQASKTKAQKEPDPQAIQRIKTEHASFRAQPRPDKVPAATFNQNYRISGSQQWQGPQYEVP